MPDANASAGAQRGMPATQAEHEDGPTRLALVCCCLASFATTLGLFLFNGTLGTVSDSVFPWSRDLSTYVGILTLLALLFVARRRSGALHLIPLAVSSSALSAAGYALCIWGGMSQLPAALAAGTALAATADAWSATTWLIACSGLGMRRAVACIAGPGVAAALVSYLVDGTGSFLVTAVASGVCGAVCPLVVLPAVEPFFERLPVAGVPIEQELVQPRAFLPFSHVLFVYIFAFNTVYGFALKCSYEAGSALVCLASVLAMAITLAFALTRHGGRAACVDDLSVAAYTCVSAGLMLLMLDDLRVGAASSALIAAGYQFSELLVWVALCSVASRNTVDAIPTVCWGTAIGYIGIVAGVALWQLPNRLLAPVLADPGSVALAQGVLEVAMVAALSVYFVVTRRSFSFDETIAQIEPDAPAPQVAVQFVDRIDGVCQALAEKAGLTSREAEVLRLLARGKTPTHIQDELGISYNTVKFHVRNVYAKLGVHGQQEVIGLVSRE